MRPGATFVTLERNGDLLGCVGALEPAEPLYLDVVRHAVAAAFSDPRLPSVTVEDFTAMSIKVSCLGPLEPVDAAGLVELGGLVRAGVDGLLVQVRGRRGTLLPSVWRELPEVDDFLTVLWRKAGLLPGTWPFGLQVSRYRTVEFVGAGPRPGPGVTGAD
jgi:AmmeMemoRadiSam system protein A